MPWAHAIELILHVVENEVDDRHELFGHLGVAVFGNGVVIIAACPQAGIAAPIVGDDQRSRHNGAFDVVCSIPSMSKRTRFPMARLARPGGCFGGAVINFLAVQLGSDLQAGVPFYGAPQNRRMCPGSSPRSC